MTNAAYTLGLSEALITALEGEGLGSTSLRALGASTREDENLLVESLRADGRSLKFADLTKLRDLLFLGPARSRTSLFEADRCGAHGEASGSRRGR